MPLTISRVWLLVVGWISRCLPLNLNYPVLPEILARGWQFSPVRILDIWGRWDTAWYFSIVKGGYSFSGNFAAQSNLAFACLYSALIKFFCYFLPIAWSSDEVILLIGVIISNIFLFFSLILFYKFTWEIFQDDALANRSVWYLLLFPTSFFFSAFYTEALYFFLVLGTFYLAWHKKWAWVGFTGFLVALTKLWGFWIFFPILWLYLGQIKWRLKSIKLDILWIFLVLLGFLALLSFGYYCSGDFLAVFKIQRQAWNSTRLAWPWEHFFVLSKYFPFITPLNQVFTLVFLFLTVLVFRFFPSLSFGIFSSFPVFLCLFCGAYDSAMRHFLVAFPAFVVLAKLGQNEIIDRIIIYSFLILQALFMAGWCQFYWIN